MSLAPSSAHLVHPKAARLQRLVSQAAAAGAVAAAVAFPMSVAMMASTGRDIDGVPRDMPGYIIIWANMLVAVPVAGRYGSRIADWRLLGCFAAFNLGISLVGLSMLVVQLYMERQQRFILAHCRLGWASDPRCPSPSDWAALCAGLDPVACFGELERAPPSTDVGIAVQALVSVTLVPLRLLSSYWAWRLCWVLKTLLNSSIVSRPTVSTPRLCAS
mmetsp:Transcript_107006/g.307794  ORF Transcript_107006/g.307794 Transcript_107006/m.307794 type:complete len:217 (-) Transcript_107006:148-798(-)|eukprot:CAMPEP_0170297510 /NCGR_PEP_ID=MMETSP0116_2-20130129/48916_1 /TAXON_ID=400756 /ORGANISM="Durinskia baltica, Strain CSIRO CS-38" /LENGTH=216 /DNA_ID=CAMNT_0010549135 /DNA_START=18 /DNA_END=668 /DNA_ORIENTATION=+